jgi:hypothetical protein
MIPTQKGVFIWQLSWCAGGDPIRLADMARAAGFQWVCIKAADGVKDFNQGGATWQGAALLPGAVAALRGAGIKVVGWQYIYGANLLHQSLAAREAEIAVQNINRFGFDCWIIDPESQYKRPGAAAWANTYMTALRSSCPDLSIGLCSYRYPTLHPELPWSEFLRRSDFHAPQVYWIGSHNPAAQLQRSVRELLALKALPVIPVGAAFYEPAYKWQPTVVDLDEFDQAAKSLNLPGITWWEWGEYGRGAEYHPDWWAAITAHEWGQPLPPAHDSWAWDVTNGLRALGQIVRDPE